MLERRGALLLSLLVWCSACTGPGRNVTAQYSMDGRAQTFSHLVMGAGYRGFGSSWEPFDDQFAFQLAGQHQWVSFPVGFEYGFGLSVDEDDIGHAGFVTSTSYDLSLGPSRTFVLDDEARWFANVGGGGQVTFVDQDSPRFPFDDDEDEWFAGYLHFGVFWRAGWNWDVGFDVRWVKGEDIELSGRAQEGEYLQLTLGTGFSW